jgi:hypothetical protein
MPTLTLPLDVGEARLEVLVGVSARREADLRRAQQPVPPPITAIAEIDTGASITGIDLAMVGRLGLQTMGTQSLHTPLTGAVAQSFPQFDIGLTLLYPAMNYHLHNLPVVGTKLAGQGIQVLLGRDVLAQCLFIYNGPANSFTLAF